MTVVLKGRNHLSFQPMQQLYDLINTKVPDINSIRSAKPTLREKQWIYPSEPESDDENYPRIALMNDSIRFQEYGSGQFLQKDKVAGNTVREIFCRMATVPITIGVFVKKKQRHNVTFYDGTIHTLQNTKQSDFLGEEIAKYIEMYRNIYFIPNGMDIKVNTITRSYDDGTFLISKNIEAEIIIREEWEQGYTDASTDLINHISTAITVQQI